MAERKEGTLEEKGAADELPLSLRPTVRLKYLFASSNLRDIDAVASGDPAAHALKTSKISTENLGRCQSMCVRLTDPQSLPFEQDPRDRVQMFDKPAAGEVTNLDMRRPPRVLDATMKHLAQHVLFNRNPEWTDLEFEKFNYIWDRYRQIRQDWTVQYDQTNRRRKWLEFMVRVFALRIPVCSRNYDDCCRALMEKHTNAETLQDCFSQLLSYYRERPRKRHAEMISAFILFSGLQQQSKTELSAAWLRSRVVLDSSAPGGERLEPEPPSESVDLSSVYRELLALGTSVCSGKVQASLLLLQALFEGEWLRFMHLCTTLPLTFLQKCFVFPSFTYVRFRAVYDIVSKGVRGTIPTKPLSKQLLFASDEDFRQFLSIVGVATEPLSPDEEHRGAATEYGIPVSDASGRNRRLSALGLQGLLELEKRKPFMSFPATASFFEFDENPDDHDAPVDLKRFLFEHYPPSITAEVLRSLREETDEKEDGDLQQVDADDEYDDGELTEPFSEYSEDWDAAEEATAPSGRSGVASPTPRPLTLQEHVEQLLAANDECMLHLRCKMLYDGYLESRRLKQVQQREEICAQESTARGRIDSAWQTQLHSVISAEHENRRGIEAKAATLRAQAAAVAAQATSTEKRKAAVKEPSPETVNAKEVPKSSGSYRIFVPPPTLPPAPPPPPPKAAPTPVPYKAPQNETLPRKRLRGDAVTEKSAVPPSPPSLAPAPAATATVTEVEPAEAVLAPDPSKQNRSPGRLSRDLYRALREACHPRRLQPEARERPAFSQSIAPVEWATSAAQRVCHWFYSSVLRYGLGSTLGCPLPLNAAVSDRGEVTLGFSLLLIGDVFCGCDRLSQAVAEILSPVHQARGKRGPLAGNSALQIINEARFRIPSPTGLRYGKSATEIATQVRTDLVVFVECHGVSFDALPLLSCSGAATGSGLTSLRAAQHNCLAIVIVTEHTVGAASHSIQHLAESARGSSGLGCHGLIIVLDWGIAPSVAAELEERHLKNALPYILVPLSEVYDARTKIARKRARDSDEPAQDLRSVMRHAILALTDHCMAQGIAGDQAHSA